MTTFDNGAIETPDWEPDPRPSPFVTIVTDALFDELARDDDEPKPNPELRAAALHGRRPPCATIGANVVQAEIPANIELGAE